MPLFTIDLLQRPPKMLVILAFLLRKEEATVSDLMKSLNLSTKTYYAAIRRLTELGLAIEREERTFPRQVFISLTERGREVARLLCEISEILEKTFMGLQQELKTLNEKMRTEEENKRMLEILLSLTDMEFTAGEWMDAESHAKRALDLGSALGDGSATAKSLMTLASVNHRRGMEDKAKEEILESLKIYTEIGDVAGASEAHYSLGGIREKGGDLEGAIEEFEKSMKLAISSKEEALQGRANLGIGRILAKKGRYKESLGKFMESIEIFERLNELDELPRAYTSAGASAFYIDIDQSLEWHEKCIEFSKRIGDVIMLGYGLSNAAGCFNKKKETKRALQYLNTASEIFERLDQKDMIVGVNIQIAWSYWQEERWTQSENRFFHAIDLARKHNLEYELGDALLNAGLMNIDRGRKGDARRRLKEALEIFERLDNQAKVNRTREALKLVSQ